MIRVALTKDVDEITEAHIETWKSAYKGQIPKAVLDNLDREQRRAMWAQNIAEYPHETAVAVHDGRIIGFANSGAYRNCKNVNKLGEIRAIYVLEEYWRKSVGSHLLEFAASSLRKNYEVAALWVLESNTRAIGFYKRHGFTSDGVTKTASLFGATLNEIRLSKSISS